MDRFEFITWIREQNKSCTTWKKCHISLLVFFFSIILCYFVPPDFFLLYENTKMSFKPLKSPTSTLFTLSNLLQHSIQFSFNFHFVHIFLKLRNILFSPFSLFLLKQLLISCLWGTSFLLCSSKSFLQGLQRLWWWKWSVMPC